VDKIELFEMSETVLEKTSQSSLGQRLLKSGEAVDRETRVVEIALSVPIAETSLGMLLGKNEIPYQFTRFLSQQ
jgi:hypothetical protein